MTSHGNEGEDPFRKIAPGDCHTGPCHQIKAVLAAMHVTNASHHSYACILRGVGMRGPYNLPVLRAIFSVCNDTRFSLVPWSI